MRNFITCRVKIMVIMLWKAWKTAEARRWSTGDCVYRWVLNVLTKQMIDSGVTFHSSSLLDICTEFLCVFAEKTRKRLWLSSRRAGGRLSVGSAESAGDRGWFRRDTRRENGSESSRQRCGLRVRKSLTTTFHPIHYNFVLNSVWKPFQFTIEIQF